MFDVVVNRNSSEYRYGYLREAEMREIAEWDLTRFTIDMTSRDLVYEGGRLTVDEVREFYDNLQPDRQSYLKMLALEFVRKRKEDIVTRNITYDFDDGLVDALRSIISNE